MSLLRRVPVSVFVLPVVVALAGCPQQMPPEPPRDPPPTVGGGASGLPTPVLPTRPEEPPRREREGGPAAPALSAPGGGEDVAEVLAPTGRERQAATTGGCQQGAHQVGDTWKVECNTCHCDDDGQVTCTVMACNVTPGRPR